MYPENDPYSTHLCPDCRRTFSCEPECDRPEVTLCPDCDRGRRPLSCGHLPGGCVRYAWGGRILCSTVIASERTAATASKETA